MEINNTVMPTAPQHSKLWLVVTILVALVAAALIWYFLYPKSTPEAVVTPEPKTTATKADATLVAATQDLKSVNVDELKVAVDELKSTLDAFE